jgi:hypothetical protein
MKRHSKKNDMADLLKNKNVLYVVLFFALLNLFSYLMLKQLDAVAFFIIIGFLTTYFSKNMIVVLLTSIISTFLLVQINILGNVQEGMENATDASGNAVDASGNEVDKKADEVKTDSPTPPDAVAGAAIDGATRAKVTASADTTPKTEKFSQKLSPARYNASDDDDVPRHKPRVDYASTLETAYDNLDKLLSSDAIKNMTEDTGRLAEKQKMLMGNIEKITPIMEKAGNILQGFDMGTITKLMKNVGSRADALKGGAKPAPEAEAE